MFEKIKISMYLIRYCYHLNIVTLYLIRAYKDLSIFERTGKFRRRFYKNEKFMTWTYERHQNRMFELEDKLYRMESI